MLLLVISRELERMALVLTASTALEVLDVATFKFVRAEFPVLSNVHHFVIEKSAQADHAKIVGIVGAAERIKAMIQQNHVPIWDNTRGRTGELTKFYAYTIEF
ncbi:MAG: hypothetical protein WAM82_11170 [Thermoanaerobaculia bacterium]